MKWRAGSLWVKANKFGYEGLAEWVSYELMRRSNVNEELIVPYQICKIVDEEGTEYDGCYSENFVSPGETLVTLDRLLSSYGYSFNRIVEKLSTERAVEAIAVVVESLTGLNVFQYLTDQLTFDAVVLNEDRHINNIAFIHRADGYRLCPYFDHGLSLLSDLNDYPASMPADVAMRNVKARPFSVSFRKQALSTSLKFNRDAVVEFLDTHELGRAGRVLRSQVRVYSNLFV
ncbi:hypothetical protein [Paenibacillus medicaginis]|uniref:HipA-like C-terminal domain-containing protein n=1 Tax=Paenibacillus medicaginis TaxID=1470560 RepID=A0ABV5C4A1_9BACL